MARKVSVFHDGWEHLETRWVSGPVGFAVTVRPIGEPWQVLSYHVSRREAVRRMNQSLVGMAEAQIEPVVTEKY